MTLQTKTMENGMSYDTNQLEQAMIRLYIEKTLLERGVRIYDEVSENLYKKYSCHLEDCYEHPEYLKNTLKVLYENDSSSIISSINNDLKEFYHYKKIARFIDALGNTC